MSANADSLPIQDVHPAEPVSTPAPEPVAPPEEKAPEPVTAPQDKAPQQISPPDMIPRWRLNEVLEQNKALRAQVPQQQYQQQPAPVVQPPKQEEFSTYEDFIEARAKHTAEQAAEAKWQALQAGQKQQEQTQQWHERIEKADTSFGEKLYEASTKNPALLNKLASAPTLRADLQLVLKEADAPVSLAEHLADNPALVFQLNQMSPDKAIREMTRMEMKLTTVNGGPSKMPSKAAPNLDPVGGGNTPAPKNPYNRETTEVDYVAATRRLPSR